MKSNKYTDKNKLGYDRFSICKTGFDRIPNNLTNVKEEEKLEIEKLLEKIENDDDVQNVFHNMSS